MSYISSITTRRRVTEPVVNAGRGTYFTGRQIADICPSAAADGPASTVSDRYEFVPTIDLARSIVRDHRLVPVRVRTQPTRIREHQGFQPHELNFRQFDDLHREAPAVGDTFVELRLFNSHGGQSSLRVSIALYRLWCSNGCSSLVEGSSIAIRHLGRQAQFDAVRDAVSRLVGQFGRSQELVQRLSELPTTEQEREEFARYALGLRWAGEEAPIRPQALVQVRRVEDRGIEAWKVFNRVQENLLRGGQQDRTQFTSTGRRHRATGPVNNLAWRDSINEALATKARELWLSN